MFRPKFLPTQPIRIQERTSTDADGKKDWSFADIETTGAGDDEAPVVYACEWKNAHGADLLEAGVKKTERQATLTMWYIPGITLQQYIVKGDNTLTEDEVKANRYEITSIDNIEERNQILVLNVKRAVNK
jgi:hypothetical protein